MFLTKQKIKIVGFGFLLVLFGCGVQDGFAPGLSSSYFLYMASITDKNLAAYSVDLGRGTLTEVPGSPFNAGTIDVFSATDPKGRFLYVADSSGSLYGFTIGTDGSLAKMAGSPYTIPQPSGVAVDPSGKFLFVSDGTVGSCAIHGYSINAATGVPTATTQGSFSVGTSLATIVASPNGTYLFATDLSDGIYSLKFDANGAVSTVGAFAAGSGAESVVIDQTGQYLYTTAIGGGVRGFTIAAATGILTSMGAASSTSGTPQTVSITSTGSYVYVVSQTPNVITAYKVGSGGALSTITGSPFANTGLKPSSGTIDPTGKYLFVANDGPGISIFNILSSGALSAVNSAPVKTGTSPYFGFAMKRN